MQTLEEGYSKEWGPPLRRTVASSTASTAYEPRKEGRPLNRTIYVPFGMSRLISWLLAEFGQDVNIGNKQVNYR